jgi:hypothetical protein
MATPLFFDTESFTLESLLFTAFQNEASMESDFVVDRANMETPNARQKATIAS